MQLEENIKAEGCRDSLVTWNGVIVDGHNRCKICQAALICIIKEEEVMDPVTRKISEYVKAKHINLKALSEDSGIPYAALYASLGDANRDRQMRGHEMIAVCKALEKNPMDFAE